MRRTLPRSLLILTLVISATSARAQTTINLSHDLVTLGIGPNLVANDPSFDARPVFRKAIDYAQAHQSARITADKGIYYFLSTEGADRYLNVYNASDLTIDLAGSTIYLNQGFLQGFSITDCARVTLANLSIDYVHPPYTHAEITSVDTSTRAISYRMLNGWADPYSFKDATQPYGTLDFFVALFRDGTFVPGTTRTHVQIPSIPGVITVDDPAPWGQPGTLATLRPGDIMVLAPRGGPGPIVVFRGDSIVLSNVSVYGSGDWAVMFDQTSNSTAERVRVLPRPGSGLLGSNADGIHFSSARQANTIRHCFVTRTLDDGIAIDSLSAATVVQQTNARQVIVRRFGFLRFPDGTPMNFFDPASAAETVGGTIISQSPADAAAGFNDLVTLTFDRDLPAQPAGAGMVYGSASQRGGGSVIDGNTVVDLGGGRGIWIASVRNVTVQHNRIDRASMGGIVVSQDTLAFPGPPAHDIVVQDNTVTGALGPTAEGTGSQVSLASIMVVTTNNDQYSLSHNAVNSGITIQRNYVGDSGRGGIWIGETDGISLVNNLVVRWSRHLELPLWGLPPADAALVTPDLSLPFALHFDANVTSTGNVTDATSTIRGAVTFSPARADFAKTASGGTVSLHANLPGLTWMAFTDQDWIAITSGASGTGDGTVTYTVTQNTSGQTRRGLITIGGTEFNVTQTAEGLVAPSLRTQPSNLTVTSGAAAVFTVAADGSPLPQYQWQVAAAGSSIWSDLFDDAKYSGTTSAQMTVAAEVTLNGARYRCVVSNSAGQVTSATAQLTVTGKPVVGVDRTALIFGAITNGAAFTGQTPPQTIRLLEVGASATSWTATSNQAWLVVSPTSGNGSATLTVSVAFVPGLSAAQSGSITITAPGAARVPTPITATLNVAAVRSQPVGSFDTPIDGSVGLAGSIAVTGWAVDDVGVTRVTICRDAVAGEIAIANPNCAGNTKVYIGDGTFVEGARPDVQAAFPNVPLNSRAGWGYLMLTDFLPDHGNGRFTIEAYAFSASGLTAALGAKTITVDNAHSTAPFGAIDTPGQGATVSGVVANFGWVLSPGNRRSDPPAGGTVRVFVDGVDAGAPTGWTSRADLSDLFPQSQYAGVNTALAVFSLDTTALSDGLHTIFWFVTDALGEASGIGSRYFTVANGAGVSAQGTQIAGARNSQVLEAMMLDQVGSGRILTGRRGLEPEAPLEYYFPNRDGVVVIEAHELDRLELHLDSVTDGAYLTPAGSQPLPPGAHLDHTSGVFTWAPGPGFVGVYDFRFGDQRVRIVLRTRGGR